MKKQLKLFGQELSVELRKILNYWIKNTIDDEHGGFYGKIDHFNRKVEKASKGLVLNARILWTFSAAYNYQGDATYLDIAHRAYTYLENFFLDKVHGGLIWEVDYRGNPINTRKQIYAQGFGIYGFSEYYKASGNTHSLDHATSLFQAIEAHSYDKQHGGYIEAFDRSWKALSDMRLSEKDKNFPKTMNTHLHILEAYTTLYRVWKNPALAIKIKELIIIFQECILDKKKEHLNVFFKHNWEVASDVVSFGHDIEAAWLLVEAALLLGDTQLLKDLHKTSMSIIDATISEGMDKDGSMYYELDRTTGFLDTERHWWVQAEAMVGLINAFQITGSKKYLEQSIFTWKFVKQNMMDKEYGEWYWSVDNEGIPNEKEDKAGFWKGPYHNSRACLEIIKRISSIIG